MKKIAFCFLIYDEILNEEIWNEFFKNVDTNKYSIYIHYKVNKPLKYFEKYKLSQSNILLTKYSDISLVYAHRRLFEEAYLDTNNYKFINVSQSCIPVKTFNRIYDKLTNDNNSYFNICPHKASFPRANDALRFLPKEKIYKSHEWFIVNREHVKLFIDKKDEERYFENVGAPEEHHFITLIKNNVIDNIIYTNDIAEGATTFTNWKGQDDSPKTYTSISFKDLAHLFNSPCLFARKFAKRFVVET